MVPGSHKGRGKHPRGMTAKPLTAPEKAAQLGPISGTRTWTHMLWDTNRVNEMPVGSFRALISLLLEQQQDALQDKDLPEGSNDRPGRQKEEGFLHRKV